MIKFSILFSAACLFMIGCYVMFKPDLSDLGFRSLFAGSFIAYAYLLTRFVFSHNSISIAVIIAIIMGWIIFGRLVSFFYDGFNFFGFYVLLGEIFLVIILLLAHKKRKNEIPYF
jgi:hypothetical protein